MLSSHRQYLFYRAICGRQAHIQIQKERHTRDTLSVSSMQYYYFVQSVNTSSKSNDKSLFKYKNKHNHNLFNKNYGTPGVHLNCASVFC